MSSKKIKKSSYCFEGMDSDRDDVVAEDPAVILARREKEDELCARMQQVVTQFDKLMENKETSRNQVADKEVDEIVAGLCNEATGGVLQDGPTITYKGWRRSEEVLEKSRCFRAFSAESLSLARFPRVAPVACESCKWLVELPSWREVVEHAGLFAQRTVMHECPVTRAFPRYLFFLMSVCDDEVAVRRLYHALGVCHMESPLTLQDFMTVFYNWGLKENLTGYKFIPSSGLQGTGLKKAPEGDCQMDTSSPEGKQDEKSQFPIYFLAVNHTLKFMANQVNQLDLQAEDEDRVLATLRMFVAALADSSVAFAAHYLRAVIFELFDCLEVCEWPEQKRQKLIYTLHMREFNIFDQFGCVRALIDPSNIKGPVCFAILQLLHGVDPNKVAYVPQLRALHFTELPPGPVAWAALQPDRIYLSLQVLADCVSCVAAADAEDPDFYGGLLRHIYRLEHTLPQMSLLDASTIKTLICHLDFLWKSVILDNLEKQGKQN